MAFPYHLLYHITLIIHGTEGAKGARLDWKVMSVEAIWIQWSLPHSKNQFEMIWGILNLPGGKQRQYTVAVKQWTWSLTILR